jgi:hypothetical protein
MGGLLNKQAVQFIEAAPIFSFLIGKAFFHNLLSSAYAGDHACVLRPTSARKHGLCPWNSADLLSLDPS